MIYFIDGDLIAEEGEARVYLYDGLLHLEIGPGHNLWMVESEIEELSKQIGDLPRGNCLEIGLGLGVASRYILSFPEVKSLTTVEINPDVIAVHQMVNYIDDPRHKGINGDGLDFILQTEEKYDFIFFDHYSIIDEDTLEMLKTYVEAAEKILAKDGIMLGWFDPYTPEEHAHEFFALFKRAVL
jgi:spermidine synthase